MDLQLTDKLCLVTASTGGIGKEIASMLAKCGAVVIVNGRSDKSITSAIKSIQESVGESARVIPAVGDLSSADGVTAFLEVIQKIETDYGPVNVVVNNLGIFHSQAFEEISDEKWSEYYETNTMSGVRLSRYFLPKMLERNTFGRIIFISSESALKPLPNMIAYAVSKTSQLSLSRGLENLPRAVKILP